MDAIHRLDQVMQLVRRQMAERATNLEAGRKTSSFAPTSQLERRPALATLKAKIQDRIRAIEPQDPRQRDKARRIMIESVLAWQFGNELLLDASFEAMVLGVEEALCADRSLNTRMSQLLKELAG